MSETGSINNIPLSSSSEKRSQLARLKLNLLLNETVSGFTTAFISQVMGLCSVPGIGSSKRFVHRLDIVLLVNMRSGLYPRRHRLLLKEAGSFGSCSSFRSFPSAQFSSKSPIESVELYPQVIL